VRPSRRRTVCLRLPDLAFEQVDRRAADEVRDERVLRTVVDLGWSPQLTEPSVRHDSDPVGQSHRVFLVVRDQDHRVAELDLEAFDVGPHVDTEPGVDM